MSEKKVQIKRQIITDETYIDTSTNKETNIIEENVFPIIDSDHISMADGKTLTESLLNLEGEDYSSTITQDYHIDRVGGDSFKNQAKSGKLENIKLYGRTVANLVGDHGSSPVTTNGNAQFKPNENMDSRVRVVDGQMDDLVIKGQSTYNILPDRTCCSDDVTNTNMSFSFKDGLDSKIIMDTGLSDKMVLKGNTMTNIVREPIGYASVHQIKDTVVPGTNENTKTLINIVDAEFGNFTSAIFPTDHTSTNYPIASMLTRKYGKLKLGTTYTVIMDIVETNAVKVKFTLSNYDYVNTGGAFTIEPPTVGRFFKSININSVTHTSYPYMEFVGNANLGCTFAFKNLMIIEGDVTDIAENLPYFTGTMSVNMEDYAEGKPKLVTKDADRTKIYGQTLVDVLGSDRQNTSKTLTVDKTDSAVGFIARRIAIQNLNNTIIKPGTEYILRFKVSDLNLDGLSSLSFVCGVDSASQQIIESGYNIIIRSNGIYQFKMKSASTFPTAESYFTIKGDASQWESSESTTRTLTISEFSMYEYQEGMENWDLPYMLGTMAGASLAKIESICNGGDKEFVDVIGEDRNEYSKSLIYTGNWETSYFCISRKNSVLKPATEYIMRLRISNFNASNAITLFFVNQNGTYDVDAFELIGDASKSITSNGIYNIKLTTKTVINATESQIFVKISGKSNASLTISEISLYEYTPDMDDMELPYMLGTKRVGYYGERKREYTLPSGLELRSLPNGIRDEFDFESGILTRRVGQMTLNGSEEQMHWMVVDTEGYRTYAIEGDYIRFWSDSSQTKNIFKHIPDKEQLASNSPNFPTLPNDGYLVKYNGRAMALKLFIEDDQQFQIKVKISDLETPNKAGLAKYLAANNVTFQYPMKEPEYIDLSGQIMENGEYKVGERINGYQDGYNPTTGIYTKRVNTIILDGSESEWKIEHNEYDYNCQRFLLNRIAIDAINNYKEINIKCNSNIFVPIKREHLLFPGYSIRFDREFIALVNEPSVIAFRIHTSRLFENSVDGFKDYLSRNPITVHYVLANEIETAMTQEEFNALTNRSNPKLHYFENGSLKCTCLSGQPKGSIRINTPTSNYYDMQLIKTDTKYTVNNFANMYIDGTKYVTSSTTPDHLRSPSRISNTKIVVNPAYDSIYPMIVEGEHTIDEIRFYGMKSSTVLMRTRGKNLFDRSKIEEGKYQGYDSINGYFNIGINQSYSITGFIAVKPNTEYIKHGTTGGAYYDINKNVIKTDRIADNRFTTPSNARYIVLSSPDSNGGIFPDDAYIMEASETDTTYEPYGGRHEFKAFVPDANGVLQAVELNRINDDLCDEIDLSTGIVTRRVGKIVWTSSKLAMNPNKDYFIYNSIITWNGYINTIKNDSVKQIYYQELDNCTNYGISFVYYPRINISEFDARDGIGIEEFGYYLDKNPITLLYELETPYTEQAYVLIDGEFKTGQMLPNGVSNGYNPITKTMTTRVASKTYDKDYNGRCDICGIPKGGLIEFVLDNDADILQHSDTNQYKYLAYSEQLPIVSSGALPRIIPTPSTTYLTLQIDKIGYNLATLKQYLSSNPITIHYQLADEYISTETLDSFDSNSIINNFPVYNEYGYKVELNSEVKLTKVIHHLPTKNMVFIPNIEANTKYWYEGLDNLFIDGKNIIKSSNVLTTPSTITSKKIILQHGLSAGTHSLIKYTGYENNLSTKYIGYMRSEAISSVKNPKVTGFSKNIITSGSVQRVNNPDWTDVISSNVNGEYTCGATWIGETFPSNGAFWMFMRFSLDPDILFYHNEYVNYSFKLKCSNMPVINVKLVQPNVDGYSSNPIVTASKDIDEWTTFTGSLKIDRRFKPLDPSSTNPVVLELVGTIIFTDENNTAPGTVDTTKPVSMSVKDVMLTKNTDVSKYEKFKEPSVSNFTIQKAVLMENGTMDNTNGLESNSDIDVRSDYIKVIPDLLYYLYNGDTLRAFNYAKYDKDKNYLGYMGNDGTCRVRIPSDVHYLRIYMARNNYDNLVFKADLPLHRISNAKLENDIYDEIDVPSMRYTRRVGKLTDLWTKTMVMRTISGVPYVCIEGTNNLETTTQSTYNLLCNTLTVRESTSSLEYNIKKYGNVLDIRVTGDMTTLDDYKTWFKNNHTDILYELNEPGVYYLDEYTDIPIILPNVYKDGTIQLDSSSEVFPVIDYRTRSNNYFRTYNLIGNDGYRIKASIKDSPINIEVDDLHNASFDGDEVFNFSSNKGILFDTDHIQDVMVIKGDNSFTLPYTGGIDTVKTPRIKCIGNNLFSGDVSRAIKYTDYYVNPLNLKPNTNYIIKVELIGSKDIMNGKAVTLWKYGRGIAGNEYGWNGVSGYTLIDTDGNIINSNKVFNTGDYCWKLAFYISNIDFQTILDNYKIELYEVDNQEESNYVSNTCRILNANTLEEIELNSCIDFTTRDEIDFENNKMIKRIGKLHLTGKTFGINDVRMGGYISGNINESAQPWHENLLCFNIIAGSKIPYSTTGGNLYKTIVSDIRFNSNLACSFYNNVDNIIEMHGTHIRINMSKDMLREPSKEAFLEWLDENPIDIYYVLLNPIEIPIKIIGNPIAYTNGNIVLESEGQIPTMEYNAIISANQQVKSSTDEVNRQQDEIDILWDTIQTSSEEVE